MMSNGDIKLAVVDTEGLGPRRADRLEVWFLGISPQGGAKPSKA